MEPSPLIYSIGPSSYQRYVTSKSRSHKKLQVAILILFIAGCANADGWGDFANNLGTGLAPLLMLFGGRVTTQYLSESSSWIDSLIFALAPLGIITAVVAAIRVGGSPILRSFIGRAKESRGEVEVALMPSTSSDVCELWNGEDVVRALGSPVLLQLVYVESDGPFVGDPKAGIYTFHEAVDNGLYKKESQTGNEKGSDTNSVTDAIADTSLDPEVEALWTRQNPPNLSLNFNTRPLDKRFSMAFALLGIFLQAGVLVFAAMVQYILRWSKNGQPIAAYAFPVVLAGTLSLAVGIFLCAQAIETSTDEITWIPTNSKDRKTVVWLQQGGQTISDRLFGSFAGKSLDSKVRTSRRSRETRSRSTLVTVAAIASFIGFVAQFIGLRATHSSVIMTQLGVVFVMTTLRSCTRVKRGNLNEILDPDLVNGYELDWLAKDLNRCRSWEVVTGFDTPDYSIEVDEIDNPPSGTLSDNPTMAVMKTRARLARISRDWNLEGRTKVKDLQSAIEATMNRVYAEMIVKDPWKNASTFTWGLRVRALFGDCVESSEPCEISLTLNREMDKDNWKAWKADESELEGVLCLWVSCLTEAKRKQAKLFIDGPLTRLKNVRLLGPATDETRVDYKLWMHRGTTPEDIKYLGHGMPTEAEAARYFGWTGKQDGGNDQVESSASTCYLGINADNSLETLCAQEVYAWFLFQLAKIAKEVGGSTTYHKNNSALERPAISQDRSDDWGKFLLVNSNLASIAEIYSRSNLGTIEEAYFCIIPAFRAAKTLPHLHETYNKARETSRKLEKEGLWAKAAEVNWWLCDSSRKTGVSRRDIIYVDAYIESQLRRLTRKIVMEATKGECNDALQPLWDLADLVCQRISSPSASKAIGLKDLYIACTATKPGADHTMAFNRAFDAALGLDIRMACTVEIVMSLARLALQNRFFREAEILARFVRIDTGDNKSEARKLILAIRRNSGQFLLNDKVEKYLSDPESRRSAARIDVHAQISTHEILDDQVPSDLLLIRGYRTLLQAAAEDGHEQIVRQMLEAGADVNAAPAKWEGRTALQAAAENGYTRIVELLLEAKANVNALPAERLGRTALQAAAGNCHERIVELLLKAKADINAAPAEYLGRTALQAAAEGGHEEMVNLLLDAKADVNAAPAERWGRTALQAAAEGGHKRVLKSLLKAGASVNAAPSGSGGRTAFQAAAEGGHARVLQLLSEVKADANAPPARLKGRTALQAAAENGHVQVVELLLKSKINVNAAPAEQSGRTALQGAAGSGHQKIVGLLLEAGADINAAPAKWKGRTALQAAAENGHEKIVAFLLKAGANPNVALAPYSGRTALQAAAGGGYEGVLELLLEAGADTNAAPAEWKGRTALQAAAENGYERIVELLLEAGADINATPGGSKGRTALQAAAESGHTRMLELLLDVGADVNAAPAGWEGRTALQAAAESGHPRIVELLLEVKADVNAAPAEELGRTALQSAAESGHTKIVELLLGVGAEVNAAPAEPLGRTALQSAAGNGHVKIVELLLEAGADVNASPMKSKGRTALQAAAEGGYIRIVELLLKAKADVNATPAQYSGRAALQAAAGSGHTEIVELLLEAGADVNTTPAEESGRTALQAAAENGHVVIVGLLLGAKADVNASPAEESGRTALQAAAGSGHERIVELLLKAKAEINAPAAWEGRTALQAAAESGHTRIVELLLEAKADVNAAPAEWEGRTALQAAAENGHEKIVELLLEAKADIDAAPAENSGQTALEAARGNQRILELFNKVKSNAEVRLLYLMKSITGLICVGLM